MMRFAIVTVAAAGMLLGTAPIAGAVTVCTTTISDKRIDGDLVVPAGKTCDLEGVTVAGSVHVGQGAYFYVQAKGAGSTAILGGVIAVNSAEVLLLPSVFVGEGVQIEGTSGATVVNGGTINGDFECVADTAGCLVSGSTVGGNMQVNNNSLLVQLEGNYIGGNLQCVGNPSIGLAVAGNTVAGHTQGQCAGTGQ
jgi:hypothetical protein